MGADEVADQRVGLVAEHDAVRLGDALQPGGEVRLGTDDRVVHPVVAAEIADIAVAGVDADAGAERLLDAALAPLGVELGQALLHGDGHPHAGARVLGHALGLRVAEEAQDGVADELVDGGAVRQRDASTSRSGTR